MANEKLQASYIDEPHVATPGNPAAGYTRTYRKSDNQKYKKTSAGVESADGGVDIDGQSSYGSPPDESLVFLAQSIGTSDFWKLTGDDMRQWLVNTVASSFSTDSRAMQHFDFDDTTNRTVTINSSTIVKGHWLCGSASQVGGTPHKILLPAGVTFDGTNRAATFPVTSAVLDARAISTTRFRVFISTDVVFTAT